MRRAIALAALLLPCLAFADQPYSPKFARPYREPQLTFFELCPTPEWPKASLRNEEQGTTTVLLTIAATGRVKSVAIVRSSGFPALDAQVLKAMPQCRFRPATIDGVPVQSATPIQYVWRLE